MPFLNPDRRPAIKYPSGYPVSVIVAFNPLGDFRPRYFCVEDDNQEIFKFKIDGISAIKDAPGVKTFICFFNAYGLKNAITLCFDITHCRWVIG